MGTLQFGRGDISPNNYPISYSGLWWTNWDNNNYSSGPVYGRVLNLAFRWGAGTGTVTGHNDIWDITPPYNRIAFSTDFNVSTTGYGAFWNPGAAATWWITPQNYYGGYWRNSSQSGTVPFVNGAGGGYAGKSGDDLNINGGTSNWYGFANPGSPGWLTTIQQCLIYVRRSGVWTNLPYMYVNRGGGGNWSVSVVYVNRGGGGNWTILNKYLNETGRHIPAAGMPVMVDGDRGQEPGWLIEGDVGWFGSVDPAALGVPDWKTSHVWDVPIDIPYTGRHGNWDTDEMVDARLAKRDIRERAERAGIILPGAPRDRVLVGSR